MAEKATEVKISESSKPLSARLKSASKPKGRKRKRQDQNEEVRAKAPYAA